MVNFFLSILKTVKKLYKFYRSFNKLIIKQFFIFKINQLFFIKYFSFNYNTGEVRMEWNQPYPVMLLKPIELPDFVLVNFSVMAIEQVFFFLNLIKKIKFVLNKICKICIGFKNFFLSFCFKRHILKNK